MSKRVRLTSSLGIPIVFSLVLLAALLLSTFAQAAPPAQPFIPVYHMVVSPDEIKLCVGEDENVFVWVPLEVNSQMKNLYYFGEQINAEISDPQVIDIRSRQSQTGPFGQPQNRQQSRWLLRQQPTVNDASNMDAMFIIRALKEGEATITFTHTVARHSGISRAESKTVHVEVTDCWQAYGWGHGYTFPVKDICGFDRPFFLKAKIPTVGGITEDSNAIIFIPFPQLSSNGNPHGGYAYVTKFTNQLGELVDTGTYVGGGDFEVLWHSQGEIREGDLKLTGTITAYHDNGFVVEGTEDTLIAFKPLPEGAICSNPIQPRLPGP